MLKRLSIFLLALLSVHAAISQTWGPILRPVNPHAGTGAIIGEFSAMMVVNGNPAIAYADQTRGDLIFMRANDANGTTWSAPVTIDYKGYVGVYLSMEIVNGNPAICYDGGNTVKYIRANDASGTTWATPVNVDLTGTPEFSSLTVVNGNPAIAYFDAGYACIRYVRANDANGSTWGTPQQLDYNAGHYVGKFNSLRVVNGNPAISYYDYENTNLKYIRANDANGTTWGVPRALEVNGFDIGEYSSMQVVDGFPAISYYDASNGRLKFIRASNADGSAWSGPITLDSDPLSGLVGAYTSLKIINGMPAVSYYDFNNGGLKYVTASNVSGTAWNAPVRVSNEYGKYTCLAQVNGKPAIISQDGNNSDIKYIIASDAAGTGWNETPFVFDELGDVGSYTSLLLVDGKPAFTYMDVSNEDLKYVRALDASGVTWGTPITLDGAAGQVGRFSSLQIVDGKPAVAYYDQENGQLKYTIANDITGSAWGTPVTVVSTGNSGQYASMQVVGGRPAVAYYDGENEILKYVRASNATGSAWGAPVIADNTEAQNVGQYASMQIVNGKPAIAYSNGGQGGRLKYVIASDANGTAWSTPVAVGGTADGGSYASLKVVNGMPAIVHIDETNGVMKYTRALDANGNTWAASISPDASPNVGYFASLQIINGNPAISYMDGDNSILKYVSATNASGTAWGTPVVLDNSGGTGYHSSLISVGTGAAVAYYNLGDALPNFLATTTGTLPVTLNKVKAYQKNNGIQVEWTALQENNINRYEVERSDDGRQFAAIGSVPAKGTGAVINYTQFDAAPLTGMNFYRIKVLDRDGTVKYSPVVSVNLDKASVNVVTVYPNPVSNNTVTIQMNLPKGTYTLTLTNSSGGSLYSKQLNHPGGSSSESIALSGTVAAGIYQLSVHGEGVHLTRQVLKN